jgi:hypothetical protein
MRSLPCLLAVMVVCVLPLTAAAAQRSETHARATELAKRLTDTGLRFFAVAVPGEESRFVAALHIPKVQLIVIAGNYSAPALLRELLLKGDFQRVYLDLNSAAEREGRFFVEDLGADGLRIDSEENTPFDITWRDGAERILYNGEWKEQKLPDATYRTRFERDAAEYATILQLLLDAHAVRTTTRP